MDIQADTGRAPSDRESSTTPAPTAGLAGNGALVGLVAATAAALGFVLYFRFNEVFRDAAVLVIAGASLGAAFGWAAGLALGVALRGVLGRTQRAVAWWWRLVLTLVLGTAGTVLLVQWQRPWDPDEHVGPWAAFVVAAVLAEAVRRLLPARPLSAAVRRGAAAVVVGGALATAGLAGSSAPPARTGTFPFELRQPGHKVAVIGIDGATWNVLEELAADGRVPNLQRLWESGARGTLLAEVSVLNPLASTSSCGIRSAAAWTSIATGRRYREHGIHDFLMTDVSWLSRRLPFRVPGTVAIGGVIGGADVEGGIGALVQMETERPTARDRGVLAVWEMADVAGLSASVFNWWVSWPPVELDGAFVTDRVIQRGVPHRWHPPELLPADPALGNIDDPAVTVAGLADLEYVPREEREGLSRAEVLMMERFDSLLIDLHRDRLIHRAALRHLEEEGQPDLLAVYFLAPDNAEHLFWRYMDPEPWGDVDPAEVAACGDVIARMCEEVDRWVGDIVAALEDDTVVVLCSDHGMGPWVSKGGLLPGEVLWPHNSGNHRRDGIVVISGGPAPAGETIEDAEAIDVVPTVAALLGLPVARDLPGRVLAEGMGLAEPPERTLDTWMRFRRPPFVTDRGGGKARDANEGYLDRLRTLGYIGER